MGLMDTITSAPGLRRFALENSPALSDDYDVEPDFSLSWDDNDADTVSVTERRPTAIHLVCRQAGVNINGTPCFGTPFASDDENLALSEDGYLINGEGHFLLGVPIDENGRPLASTPEVVHVDATGIDAAPTTRIRYRANLASFPMTANAHFEEPGSELLNKSNFARDPSAHGFGAIMGDDRMKFINHSLAGGSVTVFARGSDPVQLVFRWAKLGSLRTAGRDHWNLFYRMRRDARSGEVAWKNVGYNFIFGADGRVEDGAQSVPILDMMVDGIRLGNISLAFGTGITQFADRAGLVKVQEVVADGQLGGEFTGISLSSRGRLFAHYANTPMRPIADVHFTGDETWFQAVHETRNETTVRRAA
jgi:hypothetical protein